MVARCDGSPRWWFSLNTVTSLAPSRAGCSTYAGIRPKYALLGPTVSTVRTGCKHVARGKARDGRLHRRDELGHRQERLDVIFGEQSESLH